MIKNLIWRILPLLLNQKFKQKDFGSIPLQIQKVFLIMPEFNNDVLESQSVIDSLVSQGKTVTILLNQEKLALLQNSFSFKVIEYFPSDKSRFGFPQKNLRRLLKKEKSDLVINLYKKENIFAAYCTGLIQSEYKAAFSSLRSEKLFNIQFKAENQNSHDSYKNFLNCLYMFFNK